MRLYIAVVDSHRIKGRSVKLAIHAASKKAAQRTARGKFSKWTLRSLHHRSKGRSVKLAIRIAFMDEFPG
jgi:hypothetical protein